MREGTIKLYEGKSKKSGKPFTALQLVIGDWTKLYFVDSKFEMEYIRKYLKDEPKDISSENFLED